MLPIFLHEWRRGYRLDALLLRRQRRSTARQGRVRCEHSRLTRAQRARLWSAEYSAIPWATFTEPEVARVGLNETEARARGVDYEVTTYTLDDLERAIADEHARGFVKVLTHRGKDRILGATIVGSHAADLIIGRYHAWMLA